MTNFKRSGAKAFQTLENNLKALAGITGKVGWFPSAVYENGQSVAAVAAGNELGHGSTPPRPAIRNAISEQQTKWAGITKQVALRVVEGKMTAFDAMDALCLVAEGDISKAIEGLYEPALSPVTIELRAMKKKNPNLIINKTVVEQARARTRQPGYQTPDVSTKPLIDTGNEIKTLTHLVTASQNS